MKDIHSVYRSSSANFAISSGWSNYSEIIGNNDYQSPCRLSEAAELFIYSDKKVIQHDQEIVAIQICHFSDGPGIVLVQKKL